MRPRVSALCLGAYGLLSLSSCKENNITQNNTTNNTYVSQLIGQNGGKITGPSGAEVTFPPGALGTDTQIGIRAVSPTDTVQPPALPPNFQALGTVFALEPHGQLFALDVVLSIPHTANSEAVQLYRAPAGGTTWSPVPSLQTTDHNVVAQTKTFSYWVVGRPGSGELPIDRRRDADGGSDQTPPTPDGGLSDPCMNPSMALLDAQQAVAMFNQRLTTARMCSPDQMPAQLCEKQFQGRIGDRVVTPCYWLPTQAALDQIQADWESLISSLTMSLSATDFQCLMTNATCPANGCTPCADVPPVTCPMSAVCPQVSGS